MVNMVHQAWTDDNIGSPDTAHNFGPFTTATAVSRLVRIRSSINIAFGGVDLPPTDILVQGVAWGVQSGSAGYTPQVLPAQIGGFNFYWSELVASNTAGGASWSPPTADVGWIGYLTAVRDWRGQLPIGNTQDFYVTTGTILAGSASWVSTLSLEVDYSD